MLIYEMLYNKPRVMAMAKERTAIWISRKLRDEMNRIRGRIMAKTGRKPSWEEFLKKLIEIYKDVEEEVVA